MNQKGVPDARGPKELPKEGVGPSQRTRGVNEIDSTLSLG